MTVRRFQALHKANVLGVLLQLVDSDPDPAVRAKALFAVSCKLSRFLWSKLLQDSRLFRSHTEQRGAACSVRADGRFEHLTTSYNERLRTIEYESVVPFVVDTEKARKQR